MSAPSTPTSRPTMSNDSHSTVQAEPSTSVLSSSTPNDGTPCSIVPFTPTAPVTSTPAAVAARTANRKSTASTRRKPVPLTSDELPAGSEDPFRVSNEYALPTPLSSDRQRGSATSAHSEPPQYVLDVAMPLEDSVQVSTSLARPPSYVGHGAASTRTDLSTGLAMPFSSQEDLPTYAEEAQTEPKTLARALWKWGFVCPLLWLMGMAILWIPLKSFEDEADPEKAQKMDEMIKVLRVTELKYAKRCMFALIGLALLIAVIVVVAISFSYRQQ